MIAENAVIHPDAKLASDVSVGYFSVIGADVEIGQNTTIGSHVVIEGPTEIGARNFINHHAVIGVPPQDLKYKGERTKLVIGDDNVIREFATLHRGSAGGGGVTRIGNKCLIMAYAHVAHDCQIGNEVILANAVNMGGHVHIDDFAIIGGLSAIHQFVHIGSYAFIGGFTGVAQDVIPFGMIAGERGQLKGINMVGLKRRGFDSDRRQRIHNAVKSLLAKDLNVSHAIAVMREEYGEDSDIRELISFIESSERGICL